MASVKKEKKPVKPIVRVIAVALWMVIALLVAMIVFGNDAEEDTKKGKSEVSKQEYTVTQQRYDKAGTFYITAKADVKNDKQVNALVKQVASEHKGKQKGEVESMFVHIFNAEDVNQGVFKIAYTNKGKAQTGLDETGKWTKQ